MFAGQLEDLALRLDDAGAAHLLVFAHDLDDLHLVLPDLLDQVGGESRSGFGIEPVLSLGARKGDPSLGDPKEELPDAHPRNRSPDRP